MGTIAPGATATIRREGMTMSLNNDSDTIELLDAGGQVMDQFSYSSSQPDTPIPTGH
jgi:hypothetical protein